MSLDDDIPDRRIAIARIEQAISSRFNSWTNFLKDQQASPTICIATGHVGDKRSEPELVLCMPQDLSLDWMIQALEDTLIVMKSEQRRFRG